MLMEKKPAFFSSTEVEKSSVIFPLQAKISLCSHVSLLQGECPETIPAVPCCNSQKSPAGNQINSPFSSEKMGKNKTGIVTFSLHEEYVVQYFQAPHSYLKSYLFKFCLITLPILCQCYRYTNHWTITLCQAECF